MPFGAYPHQGYPSTSIPEEAMPGMNMLFGTNPVWAGLPMFYRVVGLKLEEMDAWPIQVSITAVAHPQNALQQLRHVETPSDALLVQGWQDLVTASKLVDENKIFFASSKPATLKDCSTRFRLAMGAKASDFAQNKRKIKAKSFAKTEPRKITAELHMLRAIMKNYTTDRDTTGTFRVGIFTSNVINAMVTVLRGTANPWKGSFEFVKARVESMSFEHYLMMFRMLVQLELGTCLFDFSNFSTACYELLNDLSFKLDKGFELESKPYSAHASLPLSCLSLHRRGEDSHRSEKRQCHHRSDVGSLT
jgi:hypothetical protein